MLCPHCPDTRLTMTDRQGIEIDYCPKCRGVWLDRGELDKLLERASASAPPTSQPPQQQVYQQPPPPPQQQYGYRKDNDDSKYGYRHPHKKKSWLSEIFD